MAKKEVNVKVKTLIIVISFILARGMAATLSNDLDQLADDEDLVAMELVVSDSSDCSTEGEDMDAYVPPTKTSNDNEMNAVVNQTAVNVTVTEDGFTFDDTTDPPNTTTSPGTNPTATTAEPLPTPGGPLEGLQGPISVAPRYSRKQPIEQGFLLCLLYVLFYLAVSLGIAFLLIVVLAAISYIYDTCPGPEPRSCVCFRVGIFAFARHLCSCSSLPEEPVQYRRHPHDEL